MSSRRWIIIHKCKFREHWSASDFCFFFIFFFCFFKDLFLHYSNSNKNILIYSFSFIFAFLDTVFINIYLHNMESLIIPVDVFFEYQT